VQFDLTPYAGRKTVIRLENCALGAQQPFAYWSDLQINSGSVLEARR
jgi:hypothetical protein